MKYIFIFDEDPLLPGKVDENFVKFADLLGKDNFCVIKNNGKLINHPTEPFVAIYYGWMHTYESYKSMGEDINKMGGKLLVSIDEYIANHHISGWYSLIQDLTFPTQIIPNDSLEAFLDNFQPDFPVFVKDFVKSAGIYAKKITSSKELQDQIAIIKDRRGFIEVGIQLRKWVDLSNFNESRFFSVRGNIISDSTVPPIVKESASRLSSRNFISIDYTTNGNEEYIVEIGDGQVSDPKNNSMEVMCKIFHVLINSNMDR